MQHAGTRPRACERIIAGIVRACFAVAIVMTWSCAAEESAAQTSPAVSAEVATTRTLSIRITDADGRPVSSPGRFRAQRGIQAWTHEEPRPEETPWTNFACASDALELSLEDGWYDVTIDVPGYAWFASRVFLDGDRTLAAKLQRAGIVTLRVDDELEKNAWITSKLEPRDAAAWGESTLYLPDKEGMHSPFTWERLAPGEYVLEANCLLPPFGREFGSEKRQVRRRVTLAPGEKLVVPIGDGVFAPRVSPEVKGELAVPRSWFDESERTWRPEVTLFDLDGREAGWVRVVVHGAPPAFSGQPRVFRWTSRMLRPGRYVMRVEPVNFWTEVVVDDAGSAPRVEIGEPAELRVRLARSGSAELVSPDWINVWPATMTEDAERLFVHLSDLNSSVTLIEPDEEPKGTPDESRGGSAAATGRARPERVRVARGQVLHVAAGTYRPQELDGDLEWDVRIDGPVCALEGALIPASTVSLRLIIDDEHASRPAGWWTSHLSIRNADSDRSVAWRASSLPHGDVEIQIPSTVSVRISLEAEGLHADPIQLAPTLGSTDHGYREFRARGH